VVINDQSGGASTGNTIVASVNTAAAYAVSVGGGGGRTTGNTILASVGGKIGTANLWMSATPNTVIINGTVQGISGANSNLFWGDGNSNDFTGGVYIQGADDGSIGGVVQIARSGSATNPQAATAFTKLASDYSDRYAYAATSFAALKIVTGLATPISAPGASPTAVTIGGGTIQANGVPASAGSGGLYLCIDATGNLYKKSSCP
jgi:hypothetical protein